MNQPNFNEPPATSGHRWFWQVWVILLAGLLSAALAAQSIKTQAEETARREFDSVCNEILSKIHERLGAHEQILRSGASFFARSNAVTRLEWHEFTERQKLGQQLPGIQGLGFALLVSPEQLAQHTQQIRAEGFPTYQVRPAGKRELYSSIIYLEPFTNRNLRAFGYDMLSETVRQTAMEQARDQDAPTLTGKVVLVQETDQDVQAGTLMYVPVYRWSARHETVAERRDALLGWVYSPYRMNDLMAGVLGRWGLRGQVQMDLQIFDGAAALPAALLFDSRSRSDRGPIAAGALAKQVKIETAGRHWLLRMVQTYRAIEIRSNASFWLVLIGGAVISLLVSGLTFSILNTGYKAQRIAKQLTAQLKQSEERWSFAIQGSGLGVWDWNVATGLVVFSPRWKQILGYAENAGDLNCLDWLQRIHPEDRPLMQSGVDAHLTGQSDHYYSEFRIHSPDNGWKWIADSRMAVSRNAAGKPLRIIGTIADITDRKLAAAKLLAASQSQQQTELIKRQDVESELQSLVEAIPDNVIFKDGQGRWLHANSPAKQFFHLDEGDWRGSTDAELGNAHPLLKPLHDACILSDENAWTVGKLSVGTECGPGLDGSTQEHEVLKVPLFYPDGRRKGLVIIGRDVTERKRVERALQFSELMTSGSRDITLRIRMADGRILDANAAAEKSYGYSRPELLELTIYRLRAEATQSQSFQQLAEALRKGILFEAIHRRKDGSCFQVEVSSQAITIAGEISMISVIRDITERKKAENHTALLQTAMESAANGLAIYALDGTITWVNDAFTRLTGYSKSEAVGAHSSLLKSGCQTPEFYAGMWQTVLGGHVWQGELVNRRRDGTLYHERKTITPVRSGGNAITHCIGVQEDITEQKQFLARITQARDFHLHLLQNAPAMICRAETDGRCNWFNRTWLNFTGRTAAQETDDGWIAGIHPQDRSGFLAEYQKAVTRKEPFLQEFRMRLHDGEYRWVILHGRPFELMGEEFAGFIAYGYDIHDAKLSAHQLRESEFRQRAILDNISDPAWLQDATGRFQAVNKAWCEFHHQTAAAALGRTTFEVLPLNVASRLTLAATQVMARGQPLELEENVILPDGTVGWLSVFLGPLKPDLKESVGTVGIARNITARKLTELELIDAKLELEKANLQLEDRVAERTRELSLLAEVIEHSAVPFVMQNKTGGLIMFNQAFAELTGYLRPELEDKQINWGLLLTPPEWRASEAAQLAKCIRTRQPVRYEMERIRKDGRRVPIELFVQPVFEQGGEFLHYRVFLSDITERQQAAALLQKVTDRLSLATSAGGVGIWDYDVVNNRLDWDDQMFRLYGITGDQFGGAYAAWQKGVHPDDRSDSDAAMQHALRGEHEFNTEFRVCWPDGTIRYIRALAQVTRDKDGRPTRSIGTNWDITKQKQAELALHETNHRLEQANRRAQELTAESNSANAAKSDFLGHMSHEIRTPMNIILGNTQLLQRDPTLIQDVKRKLTTINRSGENLLTILNDILDLAKIEAGRVAMQLGNFNLIEFANELIVFFRLPAEAKHLTLTLTPSVGQQASIRADQGKLRQVLVNLLGNAIKFTQVGGIELDITVVQHVTAGTRLIAAVTDTGPGIAPADLNRIFEKFEQTTGGRQTPGGTGLGLSICRQIVRLLGGELSVQSQPGQGSTFRVEVPVEVLFDTSHSHQMDMVAALHLPPDQPACRILIVDDVAENLHFLQELLRSTGFDARGVTSGAEALEICPQWLPHLILMDTRMPELDGHETIRRLRADARCGAPKIISVSAMAYAKDLTAARLAGADDFVPKPVQVHELLVKISELLGLDYLETKVPGGGESSTASQLDGKSLANLPEAWHHQLREAVNIADFNAVLTLIHQIEGVDSITAKHLLKLADQYDSESLLQLLDEASK